MSDQEPVTQIDDEELALRMMEGDEAALSEVLRAFGPRVRGFLRKQFGDTLDESECNYVFQQALMNLWYRIETYDPDKGSLRGWFIQIARYAALSHIRGENRHRSSSLDDPAVEDFDELEDVVVPEDSKERKRLERIDDFIQNQLVGIEREVGLTCFIVGGDPDSVRLAAKLGKTRSYIDTVKSKVKKKIREAILAIENDENSRKGGR